MIKVFTFDSVDIRTSGVTEELKLRGSGPYSIQPIIVNTIQGSPTYTVQVSNGRDLDKKDESGETPNDFVDYHPNSTDIHFDDSVQINVQKLPWQYLRIKVNAIGSDRGVVKFNLSYFDENG